MKVIVFGDICQTSDYAALFESVDEGGLLGDVLPLLRGADAVIGNLECAVTQSDDRIKKCGPCLKTSPSALQILRKAGFSALSLANNHIRDYGSQGVVDTINALDRASIAWFGAGKSTNCLRPVYSASDGRTKVLFCSFAEHEFNLATESQGGAIGFNPYVSLAQIKCYREQCDYLAVLYHGGIENHPYPSPCLKEKCHAIAEMGANLVLCQHSHCIGVREAYKDTEILYGQGNSIFGFRENEPVWNEGLLTEITLEDGKASVKYHLMNATKRGLRLAPSPESRLEAFEETSKMVTNDSFLKKSFAIFCSERSALDIPLFYGKSRATIKLNQIMKGRLFRPSADRAMVTNNLIRCDAWREVIEAELKGFTYE